MDVQADIKWIQNELKKVKDPDLIEIFKNLLRYRHKKDQVDRGDGISDAEKKGILQGIDEFERGEAIPYQKVKEEIAARLGK